MSLFNVMGDAYVRNRPYRHWPVYIITKPVLMVFCTGIIAFFMGAIVAEADYSEQNIQATELMYKVVLNDEILSVKDSLISALEGRNYSIVNILDVQQGLNNRNIQAGPILLVEFINLTKAYQITSSDERFELFAPLRAVLFEEKGEVRLLVLRPMFVAGTLGADHLSESAKKVLEEFDNDMLGVVESVQSGGF